MTTRLKNILQTVGIVLILMLVPATARTQEQKEPSAPPPPSVAAPDAEGGSPTSYIVKQGDTLWDIANHLFKDPFLWPFIWKANPSFTNPDLIYAGNKLMIPSMAPIERALQAEAAPVEPLVEKQEPVKSAPAAVEEPAPPRAPESPVAVTKPTQSVPANTSEEVPATENAFVIPEEQIYPIVDRYSMLSAGFVNNDETGDSIVGSPETGKSLFSYDDLVYVSLRNPENIKIGDKYLIYTIVKKVKHPKTGKYVGKLIKGLGILQITAKSPDTKLLTARIVLSFDSIEKGCGLTPYQEPVAVYRSSQKKAKNISGYILEVLDRRTINAQTDVVYLDLGTADGVEPGDRFSVYEEAHERNFPKKLIGEAQVFLVKEHTSTAVVQKSTEPMGKGNPVDFKP